MWSPEHENHLGPTGRPVNGRATPFKSLRRGGRGTVEHARLKGLAPVSLVEPL